MRLKPIIRFLNAFQGGVAELPLSPEPWAPLSGTWVEEPASRAGNQRQSQVRTLESSEPAGGWEVLSLPSKAGGRRLLPPNLFWGLRTGPLPSSLGPCKCGMLRLKSRTVGLKTDCHGSPSEIPTSDPTTSQITPPHCRLLGSVCTWF